MVVTGVTGRQGGAVARHLLADGWHVRGLTRDPGSRAARRLASGGVELVTGDMGDRTALLRALRGAHGVFSVQNPMTNGLEAEVAQGRNVADAASDSGVRHVVYGSAGSGEPGTGIGSWESKLEVEAHLHELGLPTTVLRPMAFMELMTHKGFFPAASTWHVMPKLMGEDRPVWWLALDDLGAIAARAFAEPERFVGADLRLASDGASIAQCRDIWQDITGRRPRRFPMPVPLFERVVGTDLPTMWRWLRESDVEPDIAETRRILPTAATVRGWVADQVARGRSGSR